MKIGLHTGKKLCQIGGRRAFEPATPTKQQADPATVIIKSVALQIIEFQQFAGDIFDTVAQQARILVPSESFYPHLNGLLGIGKITVAADDDDLNPGILLLNSADQSQPVDSRHADICKDEFAPLPGQHIQSLFSICRKPNDMKPQLLPIQKFCDALTNVFLVIRNQHIVHVKFPPFPPLQTGRAAV